MNPLPIISSLDNNVWAMSAPDFLSFKARLESVMTNAANFTPPNYGGVQQQEGSLYIPINGVLMRGLGLSEDDCARCNVTDLDYLDETLIEARDNPDISTIIPDFNSN